MIVEQVKRYAEQHGVQVLLSSQSTAQVLAAKFPICRTYQHLRARLHQLKETFGSQFTYFLVNDHTTCAGEPRSEEHTSELQSLTNLVCRLLLEKKKKTKITIKKEQTN